MKGRRAWLLPGVAALLLGPIAGAPKVETDPNALRGTIHVSGDVPERVAALPGVVVNEPAAIRFTRARSGQLRVHTNLLPDNLRAALDGDQRPTVTISRSSRSLPLPSRTLPLAMIAASILAGSVSESIPGERQQNTLQNLLSAAISRTELVAGKWLIWSTFGALSGLLAASGAMLAGRVTPGWWLLPFPTVSAATVALGMYLVRRASDVVGGATISLRTLPAALTGLGLLAWYVGIDHPLLGAMVPLGGALVAAGDTWSGPLPPLIGASSAMAMTALCLWATARDLEQDVSEVLLETRKLRLVIGASLLAALGWWTAVAGPLLWGAAGNPELTASLPKGPGVLAAGAVLLAMTLVRLARATNPQTEIGATRAPAWTWGAALGVGVLLALTAPLEGVSSLAELGNLGDARQRMGDALLPLWAGPLPLLCVVLGQETVFRGWLQRHAGPLLSSLAFAAVMAPLDPLRALVVGGLLATLTWQARGSIGPALLAHLCWVGVALTWG